VQSGKVARATSWPVDVVDVTTTSIPGRRSRSPATIVRNCSTSPTLTA
jgi:hypothetical protein